LAQITILNFHSIQNNQSYLGWNCYNIIICFALLFLCNTAIAQNVAPIATNDSIQINENTFDFLSPLDNDTDANLGDQLSFNILTAPVNGTLNFVGTDQIIIIPDVCFSGLDTIVYQTCDDGSPILCDTGLILIEVVELAYPIAETDELPYVNFDDQTISVLENDVELQGELMHIELIDGPNGGNATVVYDKIVYEPDSTNIFSNDTIFYAACDPCNHCDTSFAVLLFLNENVQPIAVDDIYDVNEDVFGTIFPLDNDFDTDNNSILINQVLTGPESGSYEIINQNSIEYLPNANFFGIDTLIYELCDDGFPIKCDTAIITLKVYALNDFPIAENDQGIVTQSQTIIISVLDNDLEVDGDEVIISIFNQSANGQIDIINNELEYTASNNFAGIETITYLLCDDNVANLCDTAIVTIEVLIDVIYPLANDDDFSVVEDETEAISPLDNDTFLVGNDTTITILEGPYNGNISSIDFGYYYQPNPNYFGIDSMLYQVCNVILDTIICDTASIYIDVISVNDAPIANNDFVQIGEEETIIIDVQANDEDLDNPDLITTILEFPINGNASIINNTSIQYVPNVNYSGWDTLTYIVCDIETPPLCDTAQVVINIGVDNDPPIALNDYLFTNEEQLITFNPLINDLDVDGDSLTVIVTSQPLNGNLTIDANGIFIYLPNVNFDGSDTINYVICDPAAQCDSAFVVIDVAFVNDAPIVTGETAEVGFGGSVEISVLDNDTDEEDYNLSFAIIDGPYNGSANINQAGNIVYSPATNFFGIDSILYLVCDNGMLIQACDTGTVIITVAQNLRPEAEDDYLVVVDDSLYTLNILENDSDPDGNSLFYVINDLVNSGTERGFIQDIGNGLITYTAYEPFNGLDSFTYTLFDDGGLPQLVDIATVYVSATRTNLSPIAQDDTLIIDQAATATINILQNDIEPENEPLNISYFSQPFEGNITLNNEGALIYQGNADYNGIDFVTYIVCDTLDNCDSAQLIVFINEFTFSDLVESIPNTITPNNDGTNDFFSIRNIESYPDNELIIVNRWGETIFSASAYQNNWAGTYQNSSLPVAEGTYYYLLQLSNLTSETINKSGFIHIIR